MTARPLPVLPDRLYHATFALGMGLLALAVVAGLVKTVVETRNLPPPAPNPWFMANELTSQSRAQEAIREYHTQSRIVRDIGASRRYAALCKAAGDVDGRIEALQDMLAFDNELWIIRELAGIYAFKERWPEAIDAYERTLQRNPGDTKSLVGLAFAMQRVGKPEKALERYQEAIRVDPRCADAYIGIGNLLGAAGRVDEAILHLRSALDVDPANMEARNNLGAALAQSGDVAGAITQFRVIIEARPDDARAHANLGQLLRRAGSEVEAAEQLAVASRLAPDNQKYRELARSEPSGSAKAISKPLEGRPKRE